MILWFTLTQVGVAVLAGLIAVVAGLVGRRPSDLTVGALALIEVLLIVQIVIALVSPFAGNPPTGSLLEFWTYLVSAASCRRRGQRGLSSNAAAGAPSSWGSPPSPWPSWCGACTRSGRCRWPEGPGCRGARPPRIGRSWHPPLPPAPAE